MSLGRTRAFAFWKAAVSWQGYLKRMVGGRFRLAGSVEWTKARHVIDHGQSQTVDRKRNGEGEDPVEASLLASRLDAHCGDGQIGELVRPCLCCELISIGV